MNAKRLICDTLNVVITFTAFVLCIYRESGSLFYFSRYMPEFLIGMAVMFAAYVISNILYVSAPVAIGLCTGYKFVYAEGFGFYVRKDTDGKITFKRKPGRITYNVYMAPPDYGKWQSVYVVYLLSRVIVFWVVSLIAFIIAECLFVQWYYIEAFYCFCAFSWFVSSALLFTTIDKFKRIRKTKNNADLRRVYWINEKIFANLYKGIPLNEQPEEYFDVSGYENTEDAADILWGKLNRLLAEGKLCEADKIIDEILDEKCPLGVLIKQLAYLDRIYIRLLNGAPDDEITDLLTDETVRFMNSNSSLITVIRTEFALAVLYYRDYESAENYRTRFEKAVKESVCPADLIGEIKLIDAVEKLAKKLQGEKTQI